jgi:hypothetical protein
MQQDTIENQSQNNTFLEQRGSMPEILEEVTTAKAAENILLLDD